MERFKRSRRSVFSRRGTQVGRKMSPRLWRSSAKSFMGSCRRHSGNLGRRAETIEDPGSGPWLSDTSHIKVQYGITYEGTPIERLSPGTRGIVLLLMYLALNTQDRRPLFIDQPEENLDPHSVNSELVPHFRSAKQRRQVVMVTHNANLCCKYRCGSSDYCDI